MFQHTAARRRLPLFYTFLDPHIVVSTHSRAEAAAHGQNLYLDNLEFQHTAARRRLQNIAFCLILLFCFNTQPRGGGCIL